MPDLDGYRGRSREILEGVNAGVGSTIELKTSEVVYEGILMPRYELADDKHIVLKMKNGYNVGVSVEKILDIKKLSEGEGFQTGGSHADLFVDTFREMNASGGKMRKVLLISTGGTIASRIDYRTGGVRPALTAEELYESVPEIAEVATIESCVFSSVYSENIDPVFWQRLSEFVDLKVQQIPNVAGVVITQGTDTLGYTSAALSFSLAHLSIPIVMVGAQRSSDRPSSDAATNLVAATVFAARSNKKGVFVAMHRGLSDDAIAIHLGTRVRKNHTSRRDAFQSIGTVPVAIVQNKEINYSSCASENSLDAKTQERRMKFEDKVALVKFYPGFSPGFLEYLVDKGFKGVVIEGSGLGHVNSASIPVLANAIRNGLIAVMASQCIHGSVRMTVYNTGRDLLQVGVIPCDDMFPETAYAKLAWAIGNKRDDVSAYELFKMEIAGEFLGRRLISAC
jgi:glutamyl-tRNA(Gln) amidotransferase subunit D